MTQRPTKLPGSDDSAPAGQACAASTRCLGKDHFDTAAFAGKLPSYIVSAIAHVSGAAGGTALAVEASAAEDAHGSPAVWGFDGDELRRLVGVLESC